MSAHGTGQPDVVTVEVDGARRPVVAGVHDDARSLGRRQRCRDVAELTDDALPADGRAQVLVDVALPGTFGQVGDGQHRQRQGNCDDEAHDHRDRPPPEAAYVPFFDPALDPESAGGEQHEVDACRVVRLGAADGVDDE